MDLAEHYLTTVIEIFRKQKSLADKAMAQLSSEQYTTLIDSESNAVAMIVKHMVGNMRSRWTDFLTTDGEKPDRNRDDEFIDSPLDLQSWEQGWAIVFATLESLKPDDLLKTVTIRNQPHSVVQAIQRQIDHYGYHVGQIVFLSKHLAFDHWQTLSVARGASRAFNQTMNSKHKP
jgi:uncharacterized damage-inducible protein DinB